MPAFDLLTGIKNATPEEALSAFSTWGAVHGSNSNYMRMALSLVDNHFRQSPASAAAAVQRAQHTLATKRPRADSSTSYESGSESGLSISALTSFGPAPRFKEPASRQPPFPGFTRGGSRGGGNASSKRGSSGGQGPPRQSLIVVLVIIYFKKGFFSP